MNFKNWIGTYLLTIIACGICFAATGGIVLAPKAEKSSLAAEDVFSPAKPPADILILDLQSENKIYGSFEICIDYENALISAAFAESPPEGIGKRATISPDVLSDIIDICRGTIYTENDQSETILGKDVAGLLSKGNLQAFGDIAALVLKRLLLPENSNLLEETLIRIIEKGDGNLSLIGYKQKQSFLEGMAVRAVSPDEFLKILKKE